MTPRALVRLVEAVEFRRGWTLRAVLTANRDRPWEGAVQITVDALVEDADPARRAAWQGQPVETRVGASEIWTFDEIERMEEADAIRLLWEFIREADEHEAREWFRVRGVAVMDPHRRAR